MLRFSLQVAACYNYNAGIYVSISIQVTVPPSYCSTGDFFFCWGLACEFHFSIAPWALQTWPTTSAPWKGIQTMTRLILWCSTCVKWRCYVLYTPAVFVYMPTFTWCSIIHLKNIFKLYTWKFNKQHLLNKLYLPVLLAEELKNTPKTDQTAETGHLKLFFDQKWCKKKIFSTKEEYTDSYNSCIHFSDSSNLSSELSTTRNLKGLFQWLCGVVIHWITRTTDLLLIKPQNCFHRIRFFSVWGFDEVWSGLQRF